MRQFTLFLFILLVGFSDDISAQKPRSKAPKTPIEYTKGGFRSPFRYVIVSGVSELEKYVNTNPEKMSIEVLIEDKAFNKANLIKLFEMLSQRFKEKPGLSVNVYTSLDAIRTPEENDGIGLKGPIDSYKRFKYAFYSRNGYGEYFTYGVPGFKPQDVDIARAPKN